MRWKWLPLALFVGLSVAALVAVRGLFAADAAVVTRASALPSDQPSKIIIVCAVTGDPGYCSRVVADMARRARLTEEERTAASGPATQVMAAVSRPSGDGTCIPAKPEPGYPTPPCQWVAPVMTLDEVRANLINAGFPDPTVRMARETDPAPFGSIVYAVPVERACLVGFVGEHTGAQVVGRLPDGTCLDR